MTPDDELRRLLRTNERTRDLTAEERARLTSRLGFSTIGTVDLELDHLDGHERPDPSRNRRRRPRAMLLATAAAVIVILGVAALWSSSTGEQVDAIDSAEPPSSIAVFCANELDAVNSALEAWGDIESWLWSNQTTTPDLGALTLAALDALAQIGSASDATGSLAETRADLAESLADEGRPAGGGPAMQIREAALLDGLRLLRDRVAELDGAQACDLTRLDAGIAASS